MYSVFGEQSFGFLRADAGVHNHVVSLLPVDWCSNTVLVTELEGYEDFVSRAVAAVIAETYNRQRLIQNIDDQRKSC